MAGEVICGCILRPSSQPLRGNRASNQTVFRAQIKDRTQVTVYNPPVMRSTVRRRLLPKRPAPEPIAAKNRKPPRNARDRRERQQYPDFLRRKGARGVWNRIGTPIMGIHEVKDLFPMENAAPQMIRNRPYPMVMVGTVIPNRNRFLHSCVVLAAALSISNGAMIAAADAQSSEPPAEDVQAPTVNQRMEEKTDCRIRV